MQKVLIGLMLLALASSASAMENEKVDLCHVTGSGRIVAISVNASSVDAHLDHGDSLAYIWYADLDEDGLGDPNATTLSCGEIPVGFVDNGDDLDDTVPNFPNSAPVIAGAPCCDSGFHFTSFTVANYTTDPDGDTLTYFLLSTTVPNTTINPSNGYIWNPWLSVPYGGYFEYTVVAFDGLLYSNEATIGGYWNPVE